MSGFTPDQIQAYRGQLLYTMQQLAPIFLAPVMAVEMATPAKMGEMVRTAVTNCRITAEVVLKEAYSAPIPGTEPAAPAIEPPRIVS